MASIIRANWCAFLLLFYTPVVSGEDVKATKVAPEIALKRLKEGNDRFVSDQLKPRDPFPAQRAKLAEMQRPFAVVLACADSRVAPELVFNQQLGDIFVVRIAGNVATPEILGSIEYAVEHLGPTLIVVIGHSSCGAVKAALSGDKVEGNLGELIKRIDVGKDRLHDKDASLAAAVRANVGTQSQLLIKQSKILKDYASSERIRIVGGVYSLKTGNVDWLDAPAKEQ